LTDTTLETSRSATVSAAILPQPTPSESHGLAGGIGTWNLGTLAVRESKTITSKLLRR